MSSAGEQSGGEQVDPAALAARAEADKNLLAQFNACVLQSDEMLKQRGVPAQRARDIAFARSLLFLPEWNIVACAVKGEKEPEIKQLAMIEVKGPDGKPCPSLAVFPTATIARGESMRMKVPFEGGFWVTLSAPIAGVVEWVHSLKVPAVSVVTEVHGNGPNCVLGVEFLDWVKKIEDQQRQQAQAPDAAGG
jgi:hypothetical protein